MSERTYRLPEHISSSEFDPFNHGTTTINYERVPDERFVELSRVLAEGWAISNIQSIEQVNEAEKYSNNFRISAPQGTFLLKESHVNLAMLQELVNRTIQFLESQAAAVAHLLPTIDDQTFSQQGSKPYCLYNFIDGEHFDGSREEIREAAISLAYLHKALQNLPFVSEILGQKGSFLTHDRNQLLALLALAEQKGPQDDFENVVLIHTEEFREASSGIDFAALESLPTQVIHQDLHPHNLMFDKDGKFRAFLDFDTLTISQRARDVAYAMHRLARTYGQMTERKKDVGVDIRDRAQVFLDVYLSMNDLTEPEIRALPTLIADHTLIKIITTHLQQHYLEDDTKWDFDLPKKIAVLREARLFEF